MNAAPTYVTHPMQDMTCEQHPWSAWPHDECGGPGMPIAASLALLKDVMAENERLTETEEERQEAWHREECGGLHSFGDCPHLAGR